MVECPTSVTTTASARIDPIDGGIVSLGGTSVVFLGGEVLEPIIVELTIPASRYVEIRLRAAREADGTPLDKFEKSVLVTIDYRRCTRTDVLSKPVTAWYINSDTKALINEMVGTFDNKLTRSVAFPTIHFSGYAIAF
ncbi:MAG: hypothetical protein ABR499_11250 [Gemmatimonadaceae bacterium]